MLEECLEGLGCRGDDDGGRLDGKTRWGHIMQTPWVPHPFPWSLSTSLCSGWLGTTGIFVAVVQSLSCVWSFATSWTAAHQASLSFTISWSLLKLMSIESMMSFNHLILCHPFSACPQISPASGSSPMSQLFRSGGQNIGASASVLPMNIQGWFPLGLTGLISLQSNGLSRVFSNTTVQKMVQLSHLYMTTGKTRALTIWTFVGKVIFLHFNMLSRFFIAFLPRSKHLLTAWLQLPSTMILETKKIKTCVYLPLLKSWGINTITPSSPHPMSDRNQYINTLPFGWKTSKVCCIYFLLLL